MNIEPYIAYAKKTFLQKTAYRFDHLMNILSTCLKIFIFWEIYQALYLGREEIGGITMAMVTTNFVLSMGLDAAFLFCTDTFDLCSYNWNGSAPQRVYVWGIPA